ncbi:MAG TPA: hypothetical protein VN896_03865 [Methylomirabilota bacterium]|jgi:hypothetical protein|nr:hypothetical protein [Methylomirabilota bacterium]
MKRLATTLGLLALAATAATPAFAVNLFSDGFAYLNGNLVPNGGWANYSGANVDVQVVAGRATGGAIGNPQNDDHRLFAAQPTNGKTYACLIVNIGSFSGAPKAIYFAELKDAGAANLVSRLYVVNFPGGGWTFGISNTSTSATVGLTRWTAPLNSGQDYTVVISYDGGRAGGPGSTLWVNPANELSPSVTDVNATATPLAVSGFGLRQSNAASTLPAEFAGTADWNFTVDNLGVGTTFDDACARPTPTSKTTWGAVKSIYR